MVRMPIGTDRKSSGPSTPVEGAKSGHGQRIKLKGGSLSGTYLVSSGGRKKIRKEISLDGDREYGFVRWHSQLKKMQNVLAFPSVLALVVCRILKILTFSTKLQAHVKYRRSLSLALSST